MLRPLSVSILALLAATSAATAADLGARARGKVLKVEAAKAEEAMAPDDSFGFIDSSNAGKAGDKGIALENTFRFGKQDGRFFVLNSKLEFTYTPMDRLQLALGFWAAHHNVLAVTNVTDRNRTAFDGVNLGAKYQFAERGQGPLGFGLSSQLSYRWQRVSEYAMVEGTRHNVQVAFQFDRALIEDRMFMALNATFGNASDRANGETNLDSGYELGGALSYRLLDSTYVGLNLRYATAYSGAWLNRKAGQALYFGPTMTVALSGGWSIVAAWTPQVWGRDMTGATLTSNRDYNSFEGHQARLKISKSF